MKTALTRVRVEPEAGLRAAVMADHHEVTEVCRSGPGSVTLRLEVCGVWRRDGSLRSPQLLDSLTMLVTLPCTSPSAYSSALSPAAKVRRSSTVRPFMMD